MFNADWHHCGHDQVEWVHENAFGEQVYRCPGCGYRLFARELPAAVVQEAEAARAERECSPFACTRGRHCWHVFTESGAGSLEQRACCICYRLEVLRAAGEDERDDVWVAREPSMDELDEIRTLGRWI